jgi:hypothetical protein
VIVQAVGGSGDAHVMGAAASTWGPSSGGEVDPEVAA